MAYQKKPTDVGVAWAKKSGKGTAFNTVTIDFSHDMKTAQAVAYLILSGQPLQLLEFGHGKYVDGGKFPKETLVLSEQYHQWLLATYTTVFNPQNAPKYDYKANQPQQAQQTPPPPPPAAPPAYAPPAPPAPVAAAPAAPVAPPTPPAYQQPQTPQQPPNPFGGQQPQAGL